jgi:peptide deformylase
MNKFEIIPDEQTPRVPDILTDSENIHDYLVKHLPVLQEFLNDCYDRNNAAGLACNQVSLNGERLMIRAFAYKDRYDKVWRMAIDPVIEEYIGIKEIKCEGCLTWKGKVIVAERSRAVKVTYVDILGNVHFSEIYKGFDAQVWQHEINHLNGIAERIEEPGFPEPKQINVGRNDLCPCGSGKKYKQCCLPLI